ncbi:MFS transporter [Kribbella catacumbae]|uniref:MFS transporter n=1 Tax=Kribbella catacumbae TaxID=460086 RepID=UPI00192BA6A8|nr:MFS transporter [Kribbella catacumbae]
MTQVLQRPEATAAKGWAAAAAMAVTVFSVVTAEMLPVGLLTPTGGELAVGEGTAGLTLTVTGLVAALSAPLLPRVLGTVDRRAVLVGLMVLLAVASLLAAWAPTFAVLVAARSVGPATSLIFSGIAVASVLGVPAGAYVGELAGGRVVDGLGTTTVTWLAGLLALAALGVALRSPARRG